MYISFFQLQRMTEQLISGVVLPTDRQKALDFEYDVEIPLYGEEEKGIT